uniref:Collagen alpha-1(XXVI) chain-like n=1 Tax=Scleropages formosus TaxID=113540 RepID=A0A8C9UYL6_SCLFO
MVAVSVCVCVCVCVCRAALSHASFRNWCQYTVSKTVSCQVHNGTTSLVQRMFQSCRWPGPCSNVISYRTLVRPTYRVAYRQVTALEWRCCPGFLGEDCHEGKCDDIYMCVTCGHVTGEPHECVGVLLNESLDFVLYLGSPWINRRARPPCENLSFACGHDHLTSLQTHALHHLFCLTTNVTVLENACLCLSLQGAPGPKGDPGESQSEVRQTNAVPFKPLVMCVSHILMSVQIGLKLHHFSDAVQQLREALKILAERVLILEHMMGIHGESLEPGSGLDALIDPVPLAAVKTRRAEPISFSSPLLGGSRWGSKGRERKSQN